MSAFRPQSIRRQVAFATGLLVIPLALGAAWSAMRTSDEVTAAVGREAASAAQISAAHIDQYLRGLDGMASALTLNACVIALQRGECDRLFASVLRDRPLLLNVMLSAPDGTIRGSGIPTTSERPAITLPYVHEVLTTGRRARPGSPRR